ncbi:MAG: septum formation protein Maf [Deltaproteobacteria bacterium]|nr:septum formation protein Maf [Deltaproteobacteria bacterium]MBW1920830.1 septum formation protein Maf [Deltaproteobacteria bacterium]MBW1936392.1 septum formation protein Maf [Deltaproteobacteria bacterium]MBW1978951.1 septum formation protein Maf [Deltaproteobacteria bacterium]MBW2044455.1 septum formation protein Maf [Deltaproteobacteria bacterium]
MIFRTISNSSPLMLASSSPRRKRLLKQIGLPFRSVPSNIPEEVNDAVLETVALARKKALAVHPSAPNSWILGADTVVVLGGSVLGKPKDPSHARSMLHNLSGKEHKVITGFCLLYPGGSVAHSEAVTTHVRVKNLVENEINAYVKTGEPFGKAGGYAIQGIGAFLVESISGSYTNVVGLPVCAVVKALLKTGALKSFPLKS